MADKTSPIKRWAKAKTEELAQQHDTDADVVKKIHKAVGEAKKKDLNSTATGIFVTRAVGRELTQDERSVMYKAMQHHDFTHGGREHRVEDDPKAKKPNDEIRREAQSLLSTWTAKKNQLVEEYRRKMEEHYERKAKMGEAGEYVKGDTIRLDTAAAFLDAGMKKRLVDIADGWDVAADRFEEAGDMHSANTTRRRAQMARKFELARLENYGGL